MVWTAPAVVAAGEVPVGVASVAAMVMALALLTVGVYGVLNWKTYWAGDATVPSRSLHGAKGARAARARSATYPFVFVLMLGFGLTLAVASLSDLSDAAIGGLESPLQPVLFVVVAVLVLLLCTILLFNRPPEEVTSSRGARGWHTC